MAKLIKCKNLKSLKRTEKRLLKMKKRIAILNENIDTKEIAKITGIDLSKKVDVILTIKDKC